MKKIITALLVCTVLCAAVFAQNASDFKIDEKGTITKYEGWDTKVVIPAQINGVPVMGIGREAFGNMGITSITLPASIKRIDSYAFASNKLTNVTIPANVVISENAFARNQLKTIVLGANVDFGSVFSEYVYYEYLCNSKKAGTYDVTVTAALKQEGDYRFFETRYGAVISSYRGNEGNRLIIPGKLGNSVVKVIGPIAFETKNISRMQLPDSLIHIGKQAFNNNQLTSITIPNSVTYIGESAFSKNQLTSVTIPNSITYIEKSVFSENQLTSVTIPNSVTSIGEQAFYRNQLTSVTIPNRVTSIGDVAFGNNQLTSVIIPNSVTSIGSAAFYSNKLTSVTIGNSVTFIDVAAFGNNQLTSVTIPKSVTTIGDNAFIRNQVTSVTFESAGITFRTSIDTSFMRENYPPFSGNLCEKYYQKDGGPGTYTTTAPVSDNSVWKKQ
jgi:hypothetical protein